MVTHKLKNQLGTNFQKWKGDNDLETKKYGPKIMSKLVFQGGFVIIPWESPPKSDTSHSDILLSTPIDLKKVHIQAFRMNY